MGKLLFLVLFVIRFAIVRGVICNDDPSLDRDVFEEHGCTCETNSSIIVGQLFALYRQAYDDCYEDDVGDSYTIDCAFSNDENLSNNTLLNRTMLDRLPVNVSGDAAYENITCLILNGNNITNITNEHMKQFPKLRRLYLDTNQLKKIDDNALMNNTELITLNIANNDLEEVPYLGYLQKLETLNMAHNQLKVMPNISHLVELGRVHLEHNNIQELPPQNFYGLYKLHELMLHHNQIRRLENGMCQDMCRLSTLCLSYNHIRTIEKDAFKGCHIEYLDLDHNDFSWLPYEDIRLSVHKINVRGVPSLTRFPQAYTYSNNENWTTNQTFPRLEKLMVHYAIHCCWYEGYKQHVPGDGAERRVSNNTIPDSNSTIPDILENCTNSTTRLVELSCLNITLNQSNTDCPIIPTNFILTNMTLDCTPHGDPFHPCYDIIEYLWLRIIIWFVIVISLCGNVLVFTVLLYGAVKKSLTVPQLMIMNLAAADFCLGLYLIFIAAADLDTAGNYFNRAFDWERSAACKTAGFFAVLSSTASICILGLITFERMTTIIFTFDSKKVMNRFKTAVCLVIVWSIAFLFAILPVADTISSYSKVSICLPVDASDTADDVYIAFLLFFTGAVCVFILVCYVILFISVKRTALSLTSRQELKLALKMVTLVVTDFAVWTPIAIFGLAGLFGGDPIIGVQTSKYIMIFIFPLNSCINPVLYSLMQSAFRNQICDILSCLGLCKDYHKRRKMQQKGLTFNATINPSRNQDHHNTSSVSSFTSLVPFNKKTSTTSLVSSECELQRYTKTSCSSRSTSSVLLSQRESKFLSPIHENISEIHEIDDPLDVVFFIEPKAITPRSGTLEIQPKDQPASSVNSDIDSGVANSDRDITPSNSVNSLDNTPVNGNHGV